MFQNLIVSVIVIVFTGMFSLVFAQTPDALKPSVITGEVVSINTTTIELKAANGMVSVAIVDATKFMKVPASAPSQRNATPSEKSAIKVGDRLMVTGILAADGRSIPARSVFLMSQDDIAEKNKKEAEEWRTRGITGKVISANAQTNQLVVETRTLMGSTNVTVTPKASASFMRYAPDSIRFDEAKTSSMTEIAAGDMIRALGDRSSDGTSFTAEKIVTGAFQTIAGTVKSIDAEKNEVVINNLATNKDLTIVVADITTLKRFPAEIAERMAGGGMGGGPRPVAPGGAPAGPPAAPNGGMGGMRGGSVDDMIDRFPSITVADLKVGDMIAISSTKNGSDRIRAIKLLAGVEPFIRMAQAAGAGRGRGSAVDGGFTIPGLDGIGF